MLYYTSNLTKLFNRNETEKKTIYEVCASESREPKQTSVNDLPCLTCEKNVINRRQSS